MYFFAIGMILEKKSPSMRCRNADRINRIDVGFLVSSHKLTVGVREQLKYTLRLSCESVRTMASPIKNISYRSWCDCVSTFLMGGKEAVRFCYFDHKAGLL